MLGYYLKVVVYVVVIAVAILILLRKHLRNAITNSDGGGGQITERVVRRKKGRARQNEIKPRKSIKLASAKTKRDSHSISSNKYATKGASRRKNVRSNGSKPDLCKVDSVDKGKPKMHTKTKLSQSRGQKRAMTVGLNKTRNLTAQHRAGVGVDLQATNRSAAANAEVKHIVCVKNEYTAQMLQLLQRSVKGVRWSTVTVKILKVLGYDLVIGVPSHLNSGYVFNSGNRGPDKPVFSSAANHGGNRCILIDFRTQSTMLAFSKAGKAMVASINYSVSRGLESAKSVSWEPLVLSYESSLDEKISMLRTLVSHLSLDCEKSWRNIAKTIPRVSSAASTVKIYDPIIESVSVNSTTSYREAICRDILKTLYDLPVTRERPTWLKSPHSKFSLELDVYCKDSAVAVEYNGKQHYVFDSISDMTDKVEKDISKLRQTRSRSIHLVVVPYTVQAKDIFRHIVLSLSCKIN